MDKEYKDLIDDIRLKYNMTGKDGEILIKCSDLLSYGKPYGVSYYVFNNLALKAVMLKNKIRLLVLPKLLEDKSIELGLKVPYELKSSPDLKAIDFEMDEEVIPIITSLLDVAIINYDAPKEFGCCARYKECSEKKECINPDKIRAKQCYYRDNLEKGNIFY